MMNPPATAPPTAIILLWVDGEESSSTLFSLVSMSSVEYVVQNFYDIPVLGAEDCEFSNEELAVVERKPSVEVVKS